MKLCFANHGGLRGQVHATHLIQIRQNKEHRMDRSGKENPSISNQLLANQPGSSEKLFIFSQALLLLHDATYVPPQRQAVHRDHRSQDCGESWQALWSLDASTSLLSPEHQSKIKAAVSTGLCYRKRHVTWY